MPGKAVLVAATLAGLLASTSAAQSEETPSEEPRALVDRYLELHNTHQLNLVMEMYAPDATFALSSDRGIATGREAIRELERFDVYANSTVQPYGMTYERRGDAWHVHLEGVVEHSDVFSALGIVIVRTQPVRDAFIIADGRIQAVIQPELQPACSKVAATGFAAMTRWLVESGDARAPDLAPDGKLKLVPGTILIAISAISDWRRASGWAPDPVGVRQCALP